MKSILFFIAILLTSIGSQAAVVSSMSSNSSVDTRLWTLSITPSSGGSVTGSGSYYRQATVPIQATPLPGYFFDSWSGSAGGSDNPKSIIVDGNKTIAAVFKEEFILIPAGSFTMGRTSGETFNNAPPVTVTLSAFYIGKNEVTQELWHEVTTWAKANGYKDLSEGYQSRHPKNYITWFDTVKWCNARSQKEGLIPCYTVNGTIMKTGTTAPTVNWTANGYRLPTEAEWEKAARGGVIGKIYPWGSDTISDIQANYRSGSTSAVGSFAENGYGLNDMAGNVWEWCWDWYGESSYVNDAADPRGIGSGSTMKVLRGGGCYGSDDRCSIAYRGTNDPMMSDYPIGFRIARNANNGNTASRDDQDDDGILDVREIYQLGTNPLLADTNANGLSDTYELLFEGNTDPFTPRVGDRVRYDLSQLGYQGTYKLVGALPKGLTFNATTGILEGKLIGTASTSKLTIQILNGKTVLRSIPLNIPVLAFPATLAGTWQTLLENQQGQPEGLLTVTITSPGTWSASYDGLGTRTLRNAKGSFDLTAAEEEASWSMTFPATSALPSGLPAVTMSFDIVGSTALAEGTHPRGTLRGFRLARGTEVPTATKTITMLIDQGAQDGFLIPAGMGWATGSISNRGAVSLKGQLGDAQAITASLSLGATGQALMWLKPYKNLNSYLGGIVSLHGSGVLPASPLHKQESGLLWYRAADSTEIAYPTGFAPMNATVGVRSHLTPASALSLTQNLGLTEQVIRGVVFDGAGLPDPNAAAKLPESFAIDAGYKMIAAPLPGQLMSPWTGLIASRSGGFTGTLGVAASNQGTLAGYAPVSGVLFPTVGSRVVGAGLVKIPIAGPKGSFRTAAIVLGTEQGNE